MLSLADKLRSNWLSKVSDFKETDDSLTNLNWLYNTVPPPSNFKLDLVPIQTCQTVKVVQQTSLPFAGSLYDQNVRNEYKNKWTGKPPFSYADLICLAMKELAKPKVTLADIYSWLMENFAYYRHTDSSWQNSVRHNLSLNKSFEKLSRDQGERGKGGFWRVHPKHMDFMESHLARCGRLAPPPAPPPPVPRSMMQEAGVDPSNASSVISSYLYSNNHSSSNQSMKNNLVMSQKIFKSSMQQNMTSSMNFYQTDSPYHSAQGKSSFPQLNQDKKGTSGENDVTSQCSNEFNPYCVPKQVQIRGRRKSQQVFLRVCSNNDDFINSPIDLDDNSIEMESLNDLEMDHKISTESSSGSSESESKNKENDDGSFSRRARRPVGSYFKMAHGYSSDEEDDQGRQFRASRKNFNNDRFSSKLNMRKRGGTEPVWPCRLDEIHAKHHKPFRVKKTFFQNQAQVNILRHNKKPTLLTFNQSVAPQTLTTGDQVNMTISPYDSQSVLESFVNNNQPKNTLIQKIPVETQVRNYTISNDSQSQILSDVCEEDELFKLSRLYSSTIDADFSPNIEGVDRKKCQSIVTSNDDSLEDESDETPLWASVFLPEDFSKISDLDSISFPEKDEAIGLFNQENSTSSESSPDSALDMFPLYSLRSDNHESEKSYPGSNSVLIMKQNSSTDSGLEQIFDLESIVIDNNGNIESFLDSDTNLIKDQRNQEEIPIDLC